MVKCNTDGAARGCPGRSTCGGIFRDSRGSFMGCFSVNIGINKALQAELLGAMWSIEIAFSKGWRNLWLECDSKLVLCAFKNSDIVPWKLRNRWNNCLLLTKQMRFQISHIFREGNHCADRLTSHGTTISGFQWWDNAPAFIHNVFFKNRIDLLGYRFS